MSKSKGRSGRPYRRKRARFRAKCEREGRPCVVCGGEIDYSLMGKHPRAWSLEHTIPVVELKRIDPNHPLLENESNFEAAHFVCNLSLGDKGFGNGRRKVAVVEAGYVKPVKPAGSRRWL